MPVSDDSVYVWATPFVTRGGALALVGRDAPRRRQKSRPRPPTSRPSPPTSRPSPAPARGSLRGRPLRVRAPSACANQHSLPVRRGLGKRARGRASRAAHQSNRPIFKKYIKYICCPLQRISAPPMAAATRAPARVVARRDREIKAPAGGAHAAAAGPQGRRKPLGAAGAN